MPCPYVIAIGASAGGVETLTDLVKYLPANLPCPLFIVVHFPAWGRSTLPLILSRAGQLPAKHATDGESIQPGQIYIAPPDHHLIIHQGYLELYRDARENGHRPAIDVTLRTAAQAYGERTIGVILSGMLDDGTAGLAAIKAQGGIAIVQDPEEAIFNGMPRSAISNVAVDHTLKVQQIAFYLTGLLTHEIADLEVDEVKLMPDESEKEAKIVADDKAALEQEGRSGHSSTLTCPDCGGVLWEFQEDRLLRFRCHTGHSYSIDSFIGEQANSLEKALWTAVRALEEKAILARRMATRAKQGDRHLSEAQFSRQAEESEQQAEIIRQVIRQQSHL